MADMIDAKEAKSLLGCDDATLNGHINGGAIRAQRVAGKLMLNRDDVMKVKGDDEGTIVLTGDSDELNIDLGKVVDDASETIIQPRKDTSGSATESITFGDDLEVVSFDDGNTKDLNFDKKKSNAGLSFTDSNTAVMTAVDETAVGGTTGPVDYTTSQMDSSNSAVGSASRRSVRSARRPAEEVKTHWGWVIVMALTVVISALFVLPYYVISLMPTDEKDAAKNVLRGSDDNGWTNFASSVAGFSVDPDKKRFESNHEGAIWIDIKDAKDNQATWRRDEYLGSAKPGERVNDFVIVEIQAEGRKAKPASGDKTYDVHDEKTDMQGDKGAIIEQRVDLGFPK
jgi:hypothetical protein